MEENENELDAHERDSKELFHRNEAISAVADEGFLGEEEEDDYEDLYNDVNVGENFLQSFRKNEDEIGKRIEPLPENKEKSTPLAPVPQQPVVESVSVVLQDDGGSSRVHGGVEDYQNVGFGGISNVNNVEIGRVTGTPAGGGGLRVEFGQSSNKVADLEDRVVSNSAITNQQMVQQHQPCTANVGITGNVNGTGDYMFRGDSGGGGSARGDGGTILFVGELHWWTTDAELELELCKYGPVKEVKFFDERASGKSKGYCQVEFYNPATATACKEGVNGHVFNGRPCIVAYASPYTVKRMGEAQVNRNQQMGQAAVNQPQRGPVDLPDKPIGVGSNIVTGGNSQVSGDSNGRGFGRGNWGRGQSQGGMGSRGPIGGPVRGWAGGMGGRGFTGNGNGFGQGIGATPRMMHPQAMMVQGFDPAFGGPMGRMGGYGGFPGAHAAPFPGIMPSFGPVGNVGLPGVAPHVNPAFFGRGMPFNSMGMMPNPGVEVPNTVMWSDPTTGGWTGEDHVGRARESSYGEEAASDHQYGEGSQERGPWTNAIKDKDRGSERDWSDSSETRYRDERGAGYDKDVPREKDTGHDHDLPDRRHRDDRDVGRDREREHDKDRGRSPGRSRERERHMDNKERYADHNRHRNREAEHDGEWDKGRSSRVHSKSKLPYEEEQRSRSRNAEYGKRRRLTPE